MSIAVKDRNAEAIISATREIANILRLKDDQIPLTADDLMPARTVKYVQNNVVVNNYTGAEGQPDE